MLKGEVKDILLVDVTPLTLAIETMGGIATPMIERNTTIPVRKKEIFSTAADGQTAVDIRVLQGERKMSADNKSIGNFRLDGIPPASRGMPQIEVTFDIDRNGILSVTAKDLGTGRDQKITITATSGLDKDEVERLRKEAESHADEDKKKKDAAELHNKLDNVVYGIEKAIKDAGDKLPADQKAELEGLVKQGREALESRDADRMRKAAEAIEKSPVVQQAMQAAAAAGQAGQAGPEASASASSSASSSTSEGPKKKPQDGAVDADFEVVDDK